MIAATIADQPAISRKIVPQDVRVANESPDDEAATARAQSPRATPAARSATRSGMVTFWSAGAEMSYGLALRIWTGSRAGCGCRVSPDVWTWQPA